MDSPTNRFIQLFSQKRYLEALRELFPDPMSPLLSQDPLDQALYHLADALANQAPKHAFLVARHFEQAFGHEIRFLLDDAEFLERLTQLQPFLAFAGERHRGISFEQLCALALPEDLRTFSYVSAERDLLTLSDPNNPWAQASQNWVAFSRKFPEYARLLPNESRPFFPLSYAAQPDFPSFGPCPMIFLEPYDTDWNRLVENLQGRPCILAFVHPRQFFQCLQFPALLDLFVSGQALPYVLTVYPNDQWSAWPEGRPPTDLHQLGPQDLLRQNLPELCRAMDVAFSRFDRGNPVDGEEADQLYEIGRKLAFALDAARYGADHYLAHHMSYALFDCFEETHKGRPRRSLPLQGEVPDYMAQVLDSLAPIQPRRPQSKKRRYRLAHVFRTVYDHSHAPSKILRSFLSHHHTDTFELLLYCTESGLFRSWDYPLHNFQKTTTHQTGSETLRFCKERGIQVRIFDSPELNYPSLALQVARQMKEDEIDIAFYHYPDPVSLLHTRLSEVPMHVLFSHGGADQWPDDHGFLLPEYLGLPNHPGFDLIIEADQRDEAAKARYAAMGSPMISEDFVLEVSPHPDTQPFTRSELGLPAEGPILTTVSLHLSSRLNREFCRVVADILKANPKAVYAPVGPIPTGEVAHQAYFEEFGVMDRVHYLGLQEHPERTLPLAHLYLNEFPYGGGIALLEAMAAGVPVVTAYDPHGRPQERYGGMYVGVDLAVPPNAKDYVELAKRLLSDEDAWNEFSRSMKIRYQTRTDVEAYVKRIETALIKTMESQWEAGPGESGPPDSSTARPDQ